MVLAMFKIEIENSIARSAQQILNSNLKIKKRIQNQVQGLK